MSEVRPKKQARNPIKRFTRYPTAAYIGELAKKIWKRPKFRVGQDPDVTEFIFSLGFSIPNRIRDQELASYLMLFDPKRTAWKRALKQAYKAARQGSVRVRDVCERVLFKVFAQALEILFEEAKHSEGPYKGFVVSDAGALLEAAKRKRRPPDRERKLCAMRMAKRYDNLLPQVKVLCKFVRGPQQSKETGLPEAVEKQFSQEWVRYVTRGHALQNLPLIAGHSNSTESLVGMQCTARQLTVGILVCEERERDPIFSVQPNRILEDYLPLGRKLNKINISTNTSNHKKSSVSHNLRPA